MYHSYQNKKWAQVKYIPPCFIASDYVPDSFMSYLSHDNLFMPYASAQSDQHFCCSLPLASLCSRAGRFKSYLVTTPEERFACVVAHLSKYKNKDTQVEPL